MGRIVTVPKLLHNKDVSLSSLLEAAMESTGSKTYVNGPQHKQKEVVRLCEQLVSRIRRQGTSGEGAFLPFPVEKIFYRKNCWFPAGHPSLEYTTGLSNSIKGARVWPSVRMFEPPNNKKASKLLTEGIQLNKNLPVMLTNVENRPITVCEEKLIESAQKKLQNKSVQNKFQPESTQSKVQVESSEKEMQPENVQCTIQQENTQKNLQPGSMQSKAQQDSALRKIKLDTVLRDILAKLALLKELQSENEQSQQQLESMQNKSQPESAPNNCQPESMPRESEPETLQKKRQDFQSEILQTKEQPESMLGEFRTESDQRKFQFKNLKANDQTESLLREFEPETSHKKRKSERVHQDFQTERLQTKEQPENVLKEFQTEIGGRKFQFKDDQSESMQREFEPESFHKKRQSEHVHQDFKSERLQKKAQPESVLKEFKPESDQRKFQSKNLKTNDQTESLLREFEPKTFHKKKKLEHVHQDFQSERLQTKEQPKNVLKEFQTEIGGRKFQFKEDQSESMQREFQPETLHKKRKSERVHQDFKSERLQKKEQPESVLREFQTESGGRKFHFKNDQSESMQREFEPETLQKKTQSDHVQQDFQSENLQTKQLPERVKGDMPLENNFKSESLQITDKSKSVQRESQSECTQKEIQTDQVQQREFQPQNICINEITPDITYYSQSVYFFPTSFYPGYMPWHSGATNLHPPDTVESNSSNSKLVPTSQSMQEMYFWPYYNVNKTEFPQFEHLGEGTSGLCNDFSSKEKHFSKLLSSLQCTTRLIMQAQGNVYSKEIIEDMNSNKPECVYLLINDILCLKDVREKLRAALPESIECLDLLQALHSDKHDLSQFKLFNFLKNNFTPSAKYCNFLLADRLFESCEECHPKNKLNSDDIGNSLDTEPSESQNSQVINSNNAEANDWAIFAKDSDNKFRTYNAVKNRTREKTSLHERKIASNEQPNLLCSTETSSSSRIENKKHHDESGYNYENDREQENRDKHDAYTSQWDPLREKINREKNLLYKRRPSNSTKKLSTEIDLSKYDKNNKMLKHISKPNSSESKQEDLETLNKDNFDSIQQVPRKNEKVSNHKDRKDFPASTSWGEPLKTDFGKSFDTVPTEKYVSRKEGENDLKVRDERTKNHQVNDKLVTKIQFTNKKAASETSNESRAQDEIKLKDATNSKDKDTKVATGIHSSRYKDPSDFKSRIRAEQIKIKELNDIIKRLETNDKTVDSKYLLKGAMLCEKNTETAGEVRIVVRQESIGEFCHIIHTTGASHIPYEQSIALFKKHFTSFDRAKEVMKKVIHNCSVCFKN
ncbi:uncharacterized protein LOC106665255 isoform X2 [Cimex lectularius]|uniref:Uncharacterized protein n=1 Tax=Cimex lectularius TaxID=79782 RepID=A0A8I6STD0_CIMLE|nr:uncharacterized protein LOC106665255 isoform X2 [Cimex lectularius]